MRDLIGSEFELYFSSQKQASHHLFRLALAVINTCVFSKISLFGTNLYCPDVFLK